MICTDDVTCEHVKWKLQTRLRRDITHDKLHFIFIFHWNCFCSCVNHYPHEEAEMSQGALQCTGWPVPLQFKDKCWQWKENWLTMIFQLHHTSYLIRRKLAFSFFNNLGAPAGSYWSIQGQTWQSKWNWIDMSTQNISK